MHDASCTPWLIFGGCAVAALAGACAFGLALPDWGERYGELLPFWTLWLERAELPFCALPILSIAVLWRFRRQSRILALTCGLTWLAALLWPLALLIAWILPALPLAS